MNLAVVQARMGSNRFPRKTLAPLHGKPMIQWLLDRLKLSKKISSVLLITSNTSEDDALAEYCEKNKIPCFRGSENNVLERFYKGVMASGVSHENLNLIRITGDCPLFDPFLLDEALETFEHIRMQKACEYYGYSPDLPDGCDFEIFTFTALNAAFEKATDPMDLEHVTPYIWKRPMEFHIERFSKPGIPKDMRFSVDYPADLKLIEALIDKSLEEKIPFLGVKETCALLKKHPELAAINSEIMKNEGLIKSALKEKEHRIEVHGKTMPRYAVWIDTTDIDERERITVWAKNMGIEIFLDSENRPENSVILKIKTKNDLAQKLLEITHLKFLDKNGE